MDRKNTSAPSAQVVAPPRPPHATDRYDGPTVVYRMYDADDRLLYVGVTCNTANRWQAHRRNSAWWKAVARKELTTYPDRSAALTAEREAIRAEKPVHNVSGHPDKPSRHVHLVLSEEQAEKVRALARQMRCSRSEAVYRLIDRTPHPSDPDMDEALRRVRAGGAR